MSEAADSSMRRDIASAYAVTAARVISWVMVSAIVFRRLGADALGLLTLVRATVGILAYTSLGLGPALVKVLADAAGKPLDSQVPLAALAADDHAQAKPVLAYAIRQQIPLPSNQVAQTYATGEAMALVLGIVGLVLVACYANFFLRLHRVNEGLTDAAPELVMLMGAGLVMRLMSDAPSGLLQARRRIALDNALLSLTELAWGVSSFVIVWRWSDSLVLVGIGAAFASVNAILLAARTACGRWEVRALTRKLGGFDWPIGRGLLALGSLIVIGQMADFLYAPTDCILINHFLGNWFVALYSPAIQIDAGLLLLVSGLAAVLYPKSALAHAAGEVERLRAYYRRGTIFSVALLLAAAIMVWALSRWIFLLWFHDSMPATRAILPLLLIHTVIGGSSAVGRSVLLAAGKAKQFTIAVLLAGTGNVVLSYVFVKYAHLGLKGIVLGTIVAVVARCAIWMPWYIRRTLRKLELPAIPSPPAVSPTSG